MRSLRAESRACILGIIGALLSGFLNFVEVTQFLSIDKNWVLGKKKFVWYGWINVWYKFLYKNIKKAKQIRKNLEGAVLIRAFFEPTLDFLNSTIWCWLKVYIHGLHHNSNEFMLQWTEVHANSFLIAPSKLHMPI